MWGYGIQLIAPMRESIGGENEASDGDEVEVIMEGDFSDDEDEADVPGANW